MTQLKGFKIESFSRDVCSFENKKELTSNSVIEFIGSTFLLLFFMCFLHYCDYVCHVNIFFICASFSVRLQKIHNVFGINRQSADTVLICADSLLYFCPKIA